MDDDKLY